MSNKWLGVFAKEVTEEVVTISVAEYEELKAQVEYFRNKVRQLEHRSYLVPRGKTASGEVTWGTPANGMDTLDDA